MKTKGNDYISYPDNYSTPSNDISKNAGYGRLIETPNGNSSFLEKKSTRQASQTSQNFKTKKEFFGQGEFHFGFEKENERFFNNTNFSKQRMQPQENLNKRFNTKNQYQRERSRKFFLMKQAEFLSKIDQNHTVINESFGQDFGQPSSIRRKFPNGFKKGSSFPNGNSPNDNFSFQYRDQKDLQFDPRRIYRGAKNSYQVNENLLGKRQKIQLNVEINEEIFPRHRQYYYPFPRVSPQVAPGPRVSPYVSTNATFVNSDDLMPVDDFWSKRDSISRSRHLRNEEPPSQWVNPRKRVKVVNRFDFPGFAPIAKREVFKQNNIDLKTPMFHRINKQPNTIRPSMSHSKETPMKNWFQQTPLLREEKIAEEQNVRLIKLRSQPFNQALMKRVDLNDFSRVNEVNVNNEMTIEETVDGRLFGQLQKKEFMVQCNKCECVVAKIDTGQKHFLISTEGSRDIYANFEMLNLSSLTCKSEAYPLENLKKILIGMLLRQETRPQMLDLNIFEIKLLHAVLVKRFKGFYVNSKLKLNKPHKRKITTFSDSDSFTRFLEKKRLRSGENKGDYLDIINQKHIVFNENDLSQIDKQQFTADFLNVLVENEPMKRLEEQLKFVLSRGEQSLIIKFLDEKKGQTPEQIDRSLKTNRYAVEVEFYQDYFGALAKKHGVPIEKFYFPRNKNKLVSNSHKTINKSYMANITLNSDYVKKMTGFIRDELLTMEKDTIRNKINNKIEKWNSFLLRKLSFEREDQILGLFDNFIKSNILENDKFKLPWSVKQIDSAIATVLDQLR